MVETFDRKERDNAVNCHALHPLCDAADPRHIVDARLAYSHFKASDILDCKKEFFIGMGVKVSK